MAISLTRIDIATNDVKDLVNAMNSNSDTLETEINGIPEYGVVTNGGLSKSGNNFQMVNTGTAGTYGPTANVTGNDNSTIKVPQITTDAKGRVTAVTERTLTCKNTWRGIQNSLTSDSTSDSLSAAQGKALANGSARDSTKAAKTEAIKSISRSGTTFTATRCDGTTFTFTQQDNNTTYSAGTGISLSGTTFSLGTAGTSGTYGPSGNVTGNNGQTIKVPQITTDAYGRVTSIVERVYTSVNTDTNTTYSAGNGLSLSGTTFSMSGSYSGNFTATKVYNAVWNDYAECRKAETIEAGRCVRESKDKIMKVTTERLMPGCKIVSDTFGHCMGENDEAKTPIAVAGRVLAYPFTEPSKWELGAAVCSAPDGTVDVMTREEIREYPERIVGTVSEIPDYEYWQAGDKDNPVNIKVNGRVWIYVR